MAKLTPWFPASVKPVRKGVYRTRFTHYDGKRVRGYAHWDGEEWAFQERTAADAFLTRGFTIDAVQAKEWRGLTARAEGGA